MFFVKTVKNFLNKLYTLSKNNLYLKMSMRKWQY